MERVTVVGSGPSAVHFTLSVLQKGHEVTMLDVGYEKVPAVNPTDSFVGLKKNLPDPVAYFLGKNYEGVLLPHDTREYYGIPPSKEFVFRRPRGFDFHSSGFAPLFSFAAGGMAEVWTAGCYPFNDEELADFPFGLAELGPCYSEVARRIGVTGVQDDLVRFFPAHENLMEPLDLDEQSKLLLAQYEKQKAHINGRLRCFFGRTRVATLSRDQGERKKCAYLGRCLWGCPNNSLYTPSATLGECSAYPNFTYVPRMRVSHFRFDSGNRVTSVVAEPAEGGKPQDFPVGKLVLAAGALCSSKIYLDSIFRATGEILQLRGLMDNRQILVPFVNLRMIGKTYNPETYQYHQVGLGVETGHPKEYVHGQVTTLKSSLVHPIAQNLPCDLKTAIFLVRNLHSALGIVNVNLHDGPREDNYVTLDADSQAGPSRLVVQYSPPAGEHEKIRRAVGTVKKALLSLGCVVPPGMAHVRPMGASAHYAGTLPMSLEGGAHSTTAEGRVRRFENLFVADGATFPFLPAKNITFSLMANAVRIANLAF
jgi:choline dehydrogenase-like flavoprotein